MAADDNIIHYSDFVKEDGSIDALINKLNELNTSFGSLICNVKVQAKELQDSIKGVKSTTLEGRRKIAAAAAATAEYQQIQKGLSSTMTEVGKQINSLQDKLQTTTGATQKHVDALTNVGKSYNGLVSEAKALISTWTSMTDKERKSAEAKELVASGAQEIRSKLSALGSVINSTIKEVNALREAQDKLNFANSEEGRALNELKQKLAAETAELNRAYKEQMALAEAKAKLNFTLSSQGKLLAEIQVQTKKASDEAKLLAQANLSAAGSYDQIKAKYELAKNALYALPATERNAPGGKGQQLQADVNRYKTMLLNIEASEKNATRLANAFNEYKLSISDVGEQLIRLKSLTENNNKISKQQIENARMLEGSYNQLKSKLQDLMSQWQALSVTEREGAAGTSLQDSIIKLRSELGQLDNSIKANVTSMTELEKAEARLAFLRTDEGKRLIKVQEETRRYIESQREQKAVIDEIAKAQERLTRAQEKLDAARRGDYSGSEGAQIKDLQQQERDASRLADLIIKLNRAKVGSYDALAAQYEINKIKLNAMSAEERNAVDTGQKLEKETLAIYKRMVHLQEATGNYKLSVGNYKTAFDGLRMSVLQVVRELPAAALSLNTFFLGISNNIPILIDEIQRAREKNEMFLAEGKKTVPISKQIVKALFSWQTALVVLLYAFSAHGEEIIKWINHVVLGKSTALSMAEALETLDKELNKNLKSYGKNIAIHRQLSDEWNRLGNNLEKQKKFIKDNQNEFSKLDISIQDVNTASKVFVTNTDDYVNALKARAKAQAALAKLSEAYGQLLELENKQEKARELGFLDKTAAYFKAIGSSFVGPDSDLSFGTILNKKLTEQKDVVQEGLEKDKAELQETIDNYFKIFQNYTDQENALLNSLGTEPKDRGPKPRDTEDTLESLRLQAYKAYQKSITDLEQDELKKRRKHMFEAYNIEVAELQKKYGKIQRILYNEDERYKTLTKEQRDMAVAAQDYIVNAIANAQKKLETDLGVFPYEVMERDLGVQLETLKLQQEGLVKGSEEEFRSRLKVLKVEEQIALAKNAQLPPAERQKESDIRGSFAAKRTEAFTEFNLGTFDQQQKLNEAKFNTTKHSEKQITKFKLEQEKERWEYQIALAESGALKWTDTQIEAAKETVKGINRELSELNNFMASIAEKGLGGSLLEVLGFDDDQINALQQAVDIIIDNIGSILEAEIEFAEKQVELAEQRTEAAQKAYDAEIEARNNGYAHSVDTAKKELLQEQRNQRQKEKLLAEAQRRKEKLDSVTQTSSLITASALLWQSFAGTGPAAPFLAAAAIAAMWGSFAAAKIKAKQVSMAGTEEYGEGGLEFLEGGSHASGNDIDLGTKNKRNKRMKAEGGEALAIINKRNTKRYRRVLPDLIDSLNKGTFEDKYANAFASSGNINLSMNSGNTIDLSKIEVDVSSIRKQNETRYYNMPDGTVIMQRRNVKRIIKN